MGLFVEHYAYIHSDADHDWAVDGGIMFFPHPRLQIDITYTRIFNTMGNLHMAGIGLAYNLNLKKNQIKMK